MSARDTADQRRNITEAARAWRDTVRSAGDSTYTQAQAEARVKRAKRLGEMNRSNNNR